MENQKGYCINCQFEDLDDVIKSGLKPLPTKIFKPELRLRVNKKHSRIVGRRENFLTSILVSAQY